MSKIVVQFKVKNVQNSTSTGIEAFVFPIICSPVSNQNIDLTVKNSSILQKLKLADFNECSITHLKIDILIGANYYWDFASGKIQRIGEGLTAVHKILGWVLSGRLINKSTTTKSSVNLASAHVQVSSDTNKSTTTKSTVNLASAHVLKVSSNTISDNQFEKFWEIESIGTEESKCENFNNDAFLNKIKFVGDRYSVPLPWKPNRPQLPDNYMNSKQQLKSLVRRLHETPEKT